MAMSHRQTAQTFSFTCTRDLNNILYVHLKLPPSGQTGKVKKVNSRSGLPKYSTNKVHTFFLFINKNNFYESIYLINIFVLFFFSISLLVKYDHFFWFLFFLIVVSTHCIFEPTQTHLTTIATFKSSSSPPLYHTQHNHPTTSKYLKASLHCIPSPNSFYTGVVSLPPSPSSSTPFSIKPPSNQSQPKCGVSTPVRSRTRLRAV